MAEETSVAENREDSSVPENREDFGKFQYGYSPLYLSLSMSKFVGSAVHQIVFVCLLLCFEDANIIGDDAEFEPLVAIWSSPVAIATTRTWY